MNDEIPLGRLLLMASREACARVIGRLEKRGHSVRFAHSALITNMDEEGTRLSTLAERAQISKQAMGVLAKELEAAGYLEREGDPADARAVLVKLTPSGRELMHDMVREMGAIETQVRGVLGDGDMATMRRCLNALLGSTAELSK